MRRVDIDDLEFEDAVVLHDGRLFTGVSFENWSDGKLRAEQEYELGRKHGIMREYARSGQLVAEVPHRHGVLHGLGRWWHENGRLAMEKFAKFGTVLWRKQWNEDGSLAGEFRLDENDELFKDVLRQEERERETNGA